MDIVQNRIPPKANGFSNYAPCQLKSLICILCFFDVCLFSRTKKQLPLVHPFVLHNNNNPFSDRLRTLFVV